MQRILGNKLKIKRMSKGLSQEVLSELISKKYSYVINQSQISDVEKGKVVPNLYLLRILIEVLCLDWTDIFEDYLVVIVNPNNLLDLCYYLFKDNRAHFAKKTLNKLFKLIKNKQNKRNYKLLIVALFYNLYWEKGAGNIKILSYIVNLINQLPQKDRFGVIEELYQFSKEHNSYNDLTNLLSEVLDQSKFSPEQRFLVYYQYVTGLYFQGKYVEALLDAKNATKLLREIPNGNQTKGYFIWRLGLIYIQLNMYEKAKESFIEHVQ
jgi:transcriptional regulator with XRE-family HTH domain